MLRTIYYRLPPSLRFLLRKIIYSPLDLVGKDRGRLMPPWRLIYTGGGDFIKIGADWVRFFRQNAALYEDSSVLDIGSGIGRIAIPLTGFLRGTYEGFDAVQQGVDWCRKHITHRFPHFHFTYVDLYNDLYKSKGARAEDFHFPYGDASFDFSCSISVFTHMLPAEVENYLRETFRVLKKGGYLVATFFILDEESKTLMQRHGGLNFRYSQGHFALLDQRVRSANVAYDRDYLMDMITRVGFGMAKEVRGHWCGRKKEQDIGFQDILVLKKG